MKFVIALNLESFPEFNFDEFCENVRERMFPKCEGRGIVKFIRKGEYPLLRSPFDFELLEGMLPITGVMIRYFKIDL
jgi:hypothetical protein